MISVLELSARTSSLREKLQPSRSQQIQEENCVKQCLEELFSSSFVLRLIRSQVPKMLQNGIASVANNALEPRKVGRLNWEGACPADGPTRLVQTSLNRRAKRNFNGLFPALSHL